MTLAIAAPPPADPVRAGQPLENGEHLTQAEFHARYLQMPARFRAELIGGVVHVPSPLRADHGDIHGLAMTWLNLYRIATPGARALDNATDILGPDSEPQPDGCLFLNDGQARVDASGYLVGPPELIVEVASSSTARDLFEKRVDYERYGVGEYLVLLLNESRAVWFARGADGGREGFAELTVSADGTLRSPGLPGLWLDAAALFRSDGKGLLAILNAGLASSEHAAFVASRTS